METACIFNSLNPRRSVFTVFSDFPALSSQSCPSENTTKKISVTSSVSSCCHSEWAWSERTRQQTNCCGASVASEQQHHQDLRRIYKRSTNSRIHHFLPECIAFNQSALRHFLPDCIGPRTTRGCHTVFSRGFQWERFNSSYVLLWFTYKTVWRRSCLTFTTLALVKVCKSGRLVVTSQFFAKHKTYPLFCKTKGIVVGSKIIDARNCGYARIEELRCAVFHVLSSFDESRDESYREQQGHNLSVHNIQPKHSCGEAIRKTVRRLIFC